MVELHGEPYGLWGPGLAVELHGEPSSQPAVVSPYGAPGGTLPERISVVPKLLLPLHIFFPYPGFFLSQIMVNIRGLWARRCGFLIAHPPLPVQFSPTFCLWGHMGGAGTPLRNTSPPPTMKFFRFLGSEAKWVVPGSR